MDNALAKRATVTELVRVYQKATEDIRKAYSLISSAQKSLNEVYMTDGGSHGLYIRDTSNFRGHFDNPDIVLKNLKKDTWRILIDHLDIKRALSIKSRKQLSDQLEKGDLPEITVEEVLGFAEAYIENLPRLLEEAIEEVFDMLRPHPRRDKEYKTNSQFEIGKKVILSYVIDEPRWSKNFSVQYHSQQDLTALENVFSALDGRGQMTKDWQSKLQMEIGNTPLSGNGRGETEFFKFRACKNGNLHLEFKRPDLVKRLNEIAGGKNLRQESAA
jgi:hypothetical protein